MQIRKQLFLAAVAPPAPYQGLLCGCPPDLGMHTHSKYVRTRFRSGKGHPGRGTTPRHTKKGGQGK